MKLVPRPLKFQQLEALNPTEALKAVLKDLDWVDAQAELLRDSDARQEANRLARHLRRLTANYLAQLAEIHDDVRAVYGDRVDEYCQALDEALSRLWEEEFGETQAQPGASVSYLDSKRAKRPE